MNTTPPIAEMERAYRERDPSYNGLFFLGVRTTGIFCRPTCPARKPQPKNVEYFPTARAALVAGSPPAVPCRPLASPPPARSALGAGYRPGKRCRPLASADQPDWASALLADVERQPSPRITDGELR